MRRHPLALPALLLALLTALWALDAVVGTGVFWAHDLRHHHMPWRAWAASEWLAGRVPWWAPGVANGFPLLADGQAGVLYPPTTLLFMALPPALALNWSVLLHTWWAALGAFQLARAHDLRPQAALVGGVAYGFSGFLASHTVYLGMQNGAAWLPWALWAILARRPAWLGLAVYMMATAGHPQAAAFGLLLCGAFALWRRELLGPALGVGLGLLAAAPQLLSTIELTRLGLREGGVDAMFSNIGALPPQELVHAVLPDAFGRDRPADVPQTYFHRGAGYWGQGLNHWEMSFFLGVPAVLLAGAALLGPKRRVAAFWAGAAALSLVLMLGDLGQLWPLLRRLPGLDGFRFPVRFSLLLTAATGVLAALGAQAVIEAPAARLRQGARALAVGGGLILLCFVGARGLLAVAEPHLEGALTARFSAEVDLPPPPPFIAEHPLRDVLFPGPEAEDPEKIPAKVRHILDDLAWSTTPWSPRVLFPVGMVLGVALLLALRDRLGAERVALGLALLLYVDLWRFGADYNGRWDRAFVESSPALLQGLDLSERGRLTVVDRRQDPALDVQLVTSSLGLLHGTRDVILTTPLLILRTEVLLWRAGLDVGDKGPQKWERLAAHRELVDLLGLRWLTSVHRVELPDLPLRASTPDGAVHLYENPRARPAAWLAPCATVATPAQVDADPVAFLDRLDADRPLVEVADGALDLPACGASATSPGRVHLRVDEPQRLVLDVDSAAPALLVQNDTWTPGWRATVDGQEAPLHRTLFAFRGLSVPAGRHEVVLRYDPGLAGRLLLLTPVILLTLLLWGLFQERGPGRRSPRAGPAPGP